MFLTMCITGRTLYKFEGICKGFSGFFPAYSLDVTFLFFWVPCRRIIHIPLGGCSCIACTTKIKQSIPGGLPRRMDATCASKNTMFVPPGMLCFIFVGASACRNPDRRRIYSGSEELEANSETSCAHAGSPECSSMILPMSHL